MLSRLSVIIGYIRVYVVYTAGLQYVRHAPVAWQVRTGQSVRDVSSVVVMRTSLSSHSSDQAEYGSSSVAPEVKYQQEINQS